MATLFKEKITKAHSVEELTAAILKIAADKNTRVLLVDANDWLERKLKEIARITRILKKKLREESNKW